MIVIMAMKDAQRQNNFEITEKQFRALQQLVAAILGAKLRQDDDSIWLRMPNYIDRTYRNQLAKFLLHPENEGTLENDEIEILNHVLNEKDQNIQKALLKGQEEYMSILTPEKWDAFKKYTQEALSQGCTWYFL